MIRTTTYLHSLVTANLSTSFKQSERYEEKYSEIVGEQTAGKCKYRYIE